MCRQQSLRFLLLSRKCLKKQQISVITIRKLNGEGDMNRDLTTQGIIGCIKRTLIIFASEIVIYSLLWIILACNDVSRERVVLYLLLGYGVFIALALPSIISCAVIHKRFKKRLKTCDVFYGNLDEVENAIVLLWPFFSRGCSVTVNGQHTNFVYSYKSVKRLVNTKVAYIFDGDVAYLLRSAEH